MLICFVFCHAGSASAANETPVEQAQYSVVRVLDAEQMTGGAVFVRSYGTGFAVGKVSDSAQIFVTNNHVVADNPQSIFITITDVFQCIPAQVLYQDDRRDIAILKSEVPISERYPIKLMSPTELNKSQDIYCLGFPGLMDKMSGNDELSSTVNDITITKGSVSNPAFSSDGVSTILSDVKVNGGNSGGPMTDENGRAVGINTAFIGDGSGQNMSLAVSVDYVMEALDSLGLSYEVAGGAETGDGDAKAPEGQSSKPEGIDQLQPLETSGKSGGMKTWYFLLPSFAAAVVFGVIWLLRRRKQKTDIERQQEIARQQELARQQEIVRQQEIARKREIEQREREAQEAAARQFYSPPGFTEDKSKKSAEVAGGIKPDIKVPGKSVAGDPPAGSSGLKIKRF